MMTANMDEFSQRLKQFSKPRNAKGCTVAEIATLQQSTSAILPEDYRLFLQTCGHGVDDFLRGSDFTYDELPNIREAAVELLEENDVPRMPDGSIVFVMHQGYQFYFLNEGGVFYYMEGESTCEKRHESFSEFFESVLGNVMT